MKKAILFIYFLASFGFFANASHIVGGYMSYKYISGTTYQVSLTVFRDCQSSVYFDKPAIIGIFNATTTALVKTQNFTTLDTATIEPPSNPCLQVTSSVCVQQGIYTANITLPDSTQGYIITYQRCCRNASIDNIVDPGGTGTTDWAYIPPTATYHNSNPVFANYPPIYICVHTPIVYDHSATDVNPGDVLRYSLCASYQGLTMGNPGPTTPTAPPYSDVTWATGYSTQNMLGSTIPISIDSVTGLLTGTPDFEGQYVVGVCVSQYRNGQLLTVTLRDFQFNVAQCNNPVADIPSADINPITGVGIYTSNCQNYSVSFLNKSTNPPPVNTPLHFAWNFGVAGSSTDTSSLTSPSYTYTDTGTYIVQLIASKGNSAQPCTDTARAIVRIYPKMQTSFGDLDTCANGPVAFVDSGFTAYGTINQWNWSFGDGNTSGQQNPVHVYSSPGTFNVQFIEGNSEGCFDTVSKSVSIYLTSRAVITAEPACAGVPVNFNTSSSSNFEWSLGNGATSNSANPTNIYTSAGTYTVHLKSELANGCEDSVAKTIVIHGAPVLTISNDTTVCNSDSVQLNAGGGVKYAWTPSSNFSNSQIPDPVVVPTNSYSASTYYVTVTDTNQCTGTDSVTVSVYPAIFVGAGPDTAVVCQHGGAATNVIQLYAGGGVAYQWSPASNLSNPDIANPVATLPGSVTVTYTVAVTDAHSCITRDSATLSFYRPITINAGPDTSFCPGLSATNVVQLYSSGGVQYLWSPSAGLSDNTLANPVATIGANTTITYTVIVTDAHECFNGDSVTISLFPMVRLVAGPQDTSLCAGGISNNDIQLYAIGASTYIWTPSATLSDPDIANPMATPSSNTTYYVTGTDVHGCVGYDSVFIRSNPLPVVSVTPSLSTCGEPTQLNATGGNVYSWQPATGLSCATCANPIATYDSTVTYTVSVTDSTTGCGLSDSVTITDNRITVSDIFRDTSLVRGNSITLGVIPGGGTGEYTYVWNPSVFLNDSSLAAPITSPTVDIVYTVLVTSGLCSDTSSLFIHVIDSVFSKIPSAFTPNGDGHDDYFFPVFNTEIGWTVKELRIYNRYGQLIYNEGGPPGWNGRFKGAEQPVGTYIYYMIIDEGVDGEHKYEGSVTLLR